MIQILRDWLIAFAIIGGLSLLAGSTNLMGTWLGAPMTLEQEYGYAPLEDALPMEDWPAQALGAWTAGPASGEVVTEAGPTGARLLCPKD